LNTRILQDFIQGVIDLADLYEYQISKECKGYIEILKDLKDLEKTLDPDKIDIKKFTETLGKLKQSAEERADENILKKFLNELDKALENYLKAPFDENFSAEGEFSKEIKKIKDEISTEISQVIKEIMKKSKVFEDIKEFKFLPTAFLLTNVDNDWSKVERLLETLLNIEKERTQKVINAYQRFKEREGTEVNPVFHYVTEIARLLLQFILAGLGAICVFNSLGGGISVFTFLSYLISSLKKYLLISGVLITLGIFVHLFNVLYIRTHKYKGDFTFEVKENRFFNPELYRKLSFILRGVGLVILLVGIFKLPYASYTVPQKAVVHLITIWILTELVLGMILPCIMSKLSEKFTLLEEKGKANRVIKFLNSLSFFSSTRAVSITWLSLKYHYRPAYFVGGFIGMLASGIFYFVVLFSFLGLSAFLGKESFHIFFYGNMILGDWFKLIFGGIVFGLAMYLLRYGIATAWIVFGSLLYTFPIRTLAPIAGLFMSYFGLPLFVKILLTGILGICMIFEEEIISFVKEIPIIKKFLNYIEKQSLFTVSKAFWHKIRESWAHLSYYQAYPRWAGGMPQKMMDKIMQEISEFGPLHVFAREVRANGGRFFLSAPFASLFIILLPISGVFGFLPFIGVLIVMCSLGSFFNQILTGNGLVTELERAGFNKITAILAFFSAVILYYFGLLSLKLILFLTWIGGFIVGLGRWIFNRFIDMIRFPLQLLVHTLGILVRQSLEFKTSGEPGTAYRGMDIRPSLAQKYPNFVNVKVGWFIGIVLLLINLLSITFKATLSNVILLYTTLIVSTGLTVGIFVMSVIRGNKTKEGRIANIAGWVVGIGYLWVLRILSQKFESSLLSLIPFS
ncbi:MAG: hypothetical protein DRO04_03215, partial [Candidatus Iainarchaeum archaeon]